MLCRVDLYHLLLKESYYLGSQDNEDKIEHYLGSDVFVPSQDGFIKTNAQTTSADVSDTLQIEEGTVPTSYEPYQPESYKIKEEYLPELGNIAEHKISSFNRLDPGNLYIGKTVNGLGQIVDGESDDYVFAVEPEQSNFLFARNMPSGQTHTFTLLLEDGTLNFRGQASFVGSVGTQRNRPNTDTVLLSGKFNDVSELEKCSLSFFRAQDSFTKILSQSGFGNRELPYPKYPRLSNRYINPTGGGEYPGRVFNITHDSDTGDKEVLIPIMLNWGYAPDNTPSRQRYLFMQENCKRDFSDISIVNEDGEALPFEIHAGNYSMIPAPNGYQAMFQDQQDRNVIIGANRGGGGIQISSDYGVTFTPLNINAQLTFMSSSGDIFYMKKDSESAEIWRATKAANYTDDTLMFPLTYQSSVISPSQFTDINPVVI